jgi:hypothetical protein
MDVHVPGPITRALRARGTDVITAQEDGADRLADPGLLDRATGLGCVLVSQDEDLLVETAMRQRTGSPFSGLIFVPSDRLSIGECINELELIAGASEPAEFLNRVMRLPLT